MLDASLSFFTASSELGTDFTSTGNSGRGGGLACEDADSAGSNPLNSSGMCRRKMDATRFDRRKYVPKITRWGDFGELAITGYSTLDSQSSVKCQLEKI